MEGSSNRVLLTRAVEVDVADSNGVEGEGAGDVVHDAMRGEDEDGDEDKGEDEGEDDNEGEDEDEDEGSVLLSEEGGLGLAESAVSGVGGRVGAANVAGDARVGDVVGVVHGEHGDLHHTTRKIARRKMRKRKVRMKGA